MVYSPDSRYASQWRRNIGLLLAALLMSICGPLQARVGDNTGTAARIRMILGTRGFARTCQDTHNIDKEAQTLFRTEVPYGASPGWKLCYQGFSDGTQAEVNILAVGIWIRQAADTPIVRRRVTFAGATPVVIAHDTLRESDAITDALRPGAVVWVTTWYRPGTPGTGLPYQTTLYNRELAGPGTESQDGALMGAVGSLTDHTLVGGFDHSALGGPMSAGMGYAFRGYQPMCLVGLPNPAYKGATIAPIFIGDSINVMQDDFSPDDGTIYTFRGYQGRFCKDRYPFLTFGQSGSASGGFLVLVDTPLFAYVFGVPGGQPPIITHLVNEYGINEIRSNGSTTATWNNRLAVAGVCLKYGVPYLQCTLTPCGADALAGPALAAGYPAFVAARGAFNDLVRTQSDAAHIPGCVGFIDPDKLLETDPVANNNVWAAGCGGNVHPNSTGHQHYAETIAPTLFTATTEKH